MESEAHLVLSRTNSSNNFRKKVSIIDVWLDLKYASKFTFKYASKIKKGGWSQKRI